MSIVEVINSIQWFSGCILLILAAYGFKYREQEIARGLIGFLVLGSLWCFCTALQPHPNGLETKILINRLKMLAILPITYMVLRMALSYLEANSKAKHFLNHLWVIPAVFMAITISPWHELLITNYAINETNGLLFFISGKLFGLYIAASRIIALIAFYIFWKSVHTKQENHKTTISLIITAILIPFFVDWVIVNVMPEYRIYQLVPVAFALTGVILIYALFFHKALELVPFARSKIIEDLSSPCLMWSKDGVLVDCNDSAQKVLKIGSRLINTKIDLEQEMKIDNHEVSIEKKIYRITYKELFTSAKIMFGGYTILTDITNSKESERDLIRINKLKTDVLAVMSHDMGGLLGLLSLNAEVLTVNFEKLSDEYKKSLAQKICDQAREVNRFSNDLMDWSKDQYSQASFSKQKINLNQVLSFIIDEIKSLAEIKNQKIIIKANDKLNINTNPKLLEIIIRNLILNAIKHGNRNSDIEIDTIENEIFVINEGVFDDYEKLNMFFLDQEKNTYSGLGLKICKEFCQILDCWVEFDVKNEKTIACIKGI